MENMKELVYKLPLLYLSNFEEGLNYYHWDRSILNSLKMRVSPNEVIHNLIGCKVAQTVIKSNSKYFVLTDLGKEHSSKLREVVEKDLAVFFVMLNQLGKEFDFLDEIVIRLPLISFLHNDRRYKFIYMISAESYLRLYIPNDLPNKLVNEFDLSINAINKTDYLEKILRANFNLFKGLNYSI